MCVGGRVSQAKQVPAKLSLGRKYQATAFSTALSVTCYSLFSPYCGACGRKHVVARVPLCVASVVGIVLYCRDTCACLSCTLANGVLSTRAARSC